MCNAASDRPGLSAFCEPDRFGMFDEQNERNVQKGRYAPYFENGYIPRRFNYTFLAKTLPRNFGRGM